MSALISCLYCSIFLWDSLPLFDKNWNRSASLPMVKHIHSGGTVRAVGTIILSEFQEGERYGGNYQKELYRQLMEIMAKVDSLEAGLR